MRNTTAAIGCLCISALLWNGFILVFDALIWREVSQQQRVTQVFVPAQATVIGSVVEEGVAPSPDPKIPDTTTYSPHITYEYDIDGNAMTADRYSYINWSQDNPDYAQSIVDQYSPGQQITVFYDPSDPAEVVIDPTTDAFPFVIILLLTPFHCVGAGLLLATATQWRRRSLSDLQRAVAPLIVKQSSNRIILRDQSLSLPFAFLIALGVSTFIATFAVLLLGGGFNAPLDLVTGAVLICFVMSAAYMGKGAARRSSPGRRTIININNNTITCGQDATQFPINSVAKIKIDSATKLKNNREAWYTHTVSVALNDKRDIRLVAAKGHKEKARQLRKWFEQELKLTGSS